MLTKFDAARLKRSLPALRLPLPGAGGKAAIKIALPKLPPKLALDPAARVRMKARLRAWWEGVEFDPAGLPLPPAPEPAEPEPEPEDRVRAIAEDAAGEEGPEPDDGDEFSEAALRRGRKATTWHDPLVLVSESLWGYGHVLPGGTKVPIDWLKPLGLNSKMTLLHIGAGLGGVSRAIAKELGVWVTGIEERAGYVEGAMELSVMAGLGKKAPIKLFNPSKPELAAFGKFNTVFAQECLWRMPSRQSFLEQVAEVTRKKGHLVAIDYCRGEDAEAAAAWRAEEKPPAEPWSIEELKQALKEVGFDVRVAENVTLSHTNLIEKAVAAYCRRLKPQAMDKIMARVVLGEVECWARRARALRAEGLRAYRIDAIRKS